LIKPEDGRSRDLQGDAPTVNGTQPGSIAAIVQNFKSVSTRKINQMNQSSGRTIWQRNYYEHIIRSDRVLHYIRQYIQNNSSSWYQDPLHPDNPFKG
jgi:REP element-mobilizing transposase RayT